MASLAAATGLIIMAPDQGLLPPVIVLTVMLSIKWLLDKANYRSEKIEHLTEGHFSILIRDGVLQTDEMLQTRMSREQLFAQLRESGIIHLGKVKRMYIEANGAFTVIKDKGNNPGLPVIPGWDKDFLAGLHRVNDMDVCSHCGNIKERQSDACKNCNALPTEHPVTD
jgi:uncharacterized membrane protein YcaP (DUF421 family)